MKAHSMQMGKLRSRENTGNRRKSEVDMLGQHPSSATSWLCDSETMLVPCAHQHFLLCKTDIIMAQGGFQD